MTFGPSRNRRGIDIHAMVDAIAAVMSMEDKEFYKVGELAVAVMIETATAITGDPYKVSMITAKPKKKSNNDKVIF